ncbi:MAG TPA: DUF308 domain-containing protein [Candidatus Saccharimonadales bacterium]|nr:DUF308 domain-containing protein [Candidatus Saccharimonadales bacterium]
MNEMSHVTGGLVLRGVVATLFGVAAVFWPGITLVTLIYLFSAFVLISGIVNLVFGLTKLFRGVTSWYAVVLNLVLGVLEVGVGVYLLRHINVGFTTLVLLIGFLLIVRGLFEVVEGLLGTRTAGHRVVLVVVGLLALAAGIIMLFQPVSGGVAFVWILGLYGIIAGPLMIAAAVELNRLSAAPARSR